MNENSLVDFGILAITIMWLECWIVVRVWLWVCIGIWLIVHGDTTPSLLVIRGTPSLCSSINKFPYLVYKELP